MAYNEKSLLNLNRKKVWVCPGETCTIRVPISIHKEVLSLAHFLDKEKHERFSTSIYGLIPIRETFIALNSFTISKKSLRSELEKFDKFLSLYLERPLDVPLELPIYVSKSIAKNKST
jgi:hypothetical protein